LALFSFQRIFVLLSCLLKQNLKRGPCNQVISTGYSVPKMGTIIAATDKNHSLILPFRI